MLPVQPLRGGSGSGPTCATTASCWSIDGLVAYTGSQNFIDSSYNLPKNLKRGLHWKDLMVRFEDRS